MWKIKIYFLVMNKESKYYVTQNFRFFDKVNAKIEVNLVIQQLPCASINICPKLSKFLIARLKKILVTFCQVKIQMH